MNVDQRRCLRLAENAHGRMKHEEANAARWVKASLNEGVPILTLARALGVSRTRIRTLARGGDSR